MIVYIAKSSTHAERARAKKSVSQGSKKRKREESVRYLVARLPSRNYQ
jgi:hypothetical protein